ncbi:class III cytochrome C family protein [bacterium]|nr:class III cytochrome C family protein [bacterium]
MVKRSSILLIVIAIAGWLTYLFPKEAITPGNLLEKHNQLEVNCLNCHDLFQGPSDEKCIQCHAKEQIGTLNSNNQIVDQKKKRLSFHAGLASDSCLSCHREHQGGLAAGSTTQFSHELLGIEDTKNCTECHSKPTNSIHQQSEQPCSQCHQTTNWASTEIDHDNYFRFDKDHRTNCSVCHPNSTYKEYTCYGCHEHSPRKIEREHLKEGISDFENCAECHSSGNEHDVRNTRKVRIPESRSKREGFKNRDRKPEHSPDRRTRKKHHDKDDHDD